MDYRECVCLDDRVGKCFHQWCGDTVVEWCRWWHYSRYTQWHNTVSNGRCEFPPSTLGLSGWASGEIKKGNGHLHWSLFLLWQHSGVCSFIPRDGFTTSRQSTFGRNITQWLEENWLWRVCHTVGLSWTEKVTLIHRRVDQWCMIFSQRRLGRSLTQRESKLGIMTCYQSVSGLTGTGSSRWSGSPVPDLAGEVFHRLEPTGSPVWTGYVGRNELPVSHCWLSFLDSLTIVS
jgi:hypothetical protein